MKISVFSKSIVGYKNKIKNKSSQDYLKYENIENGVICAIADGHSGEFFVNSDKGAKFACEAAIEVLKKYENKNKSQMQSLIEDKSLQFEIYNKWREFVLQDMKNKFPMVFKYNYFKYGTTLLITMIKDDYIFNLKLGDGEILMKNDNKIRKILPSYRQSVVDCLAEEKAYNKMICNIIDFESNVSNIIVYSDGFENSFNSYENMINELDNTLIKYNRNIFSKNNLEKNYNIYLNKLSEKGSLDDISIIFINISR